MGQSFDGRMTFAGGLRFEDGGGATRRLGAVGIVRRHAVDEERRSVDDGWDWEEVGVVTMGAGVLVPAAASCALRLSRCSL